MAPEWSNGTIINGYWPGSEYSHTTIYHWSWAEAGLNQPSYEDLQWTQPNGSRMSPIWLYRGYVDSYHFPRSLLCYDNYNRMQIYNVLALSVYRVLSCVLFQYTNTRPYEVRYRQSNDFQMRGMTVPESQSIPQTITVPEVQERSTVTCIHQLRRIPAANAPGDESTGGLRERRYVHRVIKHLAGNRNPTDGPPRRPDYEIGYERPTVRLLATLAAVESYDLLPAIKPAQATDYTGYRREQENRQYPNGQLLWPDRTVERRVQRCIRIGKSSQRPRTMKRG